MEPEHLVNKRRRVDSQHRDDQWLCGMWTCKLCTYRHDGGEASFLACKVCASLRVDKVPKTETDTTSTIIPSSSDASERVLNNIIINDDTTPQPQCDKSETNNPPNVHPNSEAASNTMSKIQTLSKSPISQATPPHPPLSTMPQVNEPWVPTIVKNDTIKGLYLLPDFISQEEEKRLIKELDSDEPRWTISHFNGICYGKRWGVTTNLKERTVREHDSSKGEFALPTSDDSVFTLILSRLSQLNFTKLAKLPARIDKQPPWKPNEANANDYYRLRGHGLSAHFDDRHLSGPLLATLSMSGNAQMTFSHPDGRELPVLLPQRSLQLVTQEARYYWKHSIKNKHLHSDRRTSITFRQSKLTSPPKVSKVRDGTD